jgi:hypothetical protein
MNRDGLTLCFLDPNPKFIELSRIYFRGGIRHETGGFLGLRKSDDVPDRIGMAEDHIEPIKAEGNPTVWRGPIFEGFQ